MIFFFFGGRLLDSLGIQFHFSHGLSSLIAEYTHLFRINENFHAQKKTEHYKLNKNCLKLNPLRFVFGSVDFDQLP